MGINITVRPRNMPPGSAWWTATWYVPPSQWDSGWWTPEGEFTWMNIPETGTFYATAYDRDFNILANLDAWGRFTLASGTYWADFATRRLEGVAVPPPPPPPPEDEAPPGGLPREWVLIPIMGGLAVGMGAVALVGRRGAPVAR